MKLSRLFTASCFAAALSAAGAVAQDAAVVRVRAIAGADGKLEVVEEKIVGPEKSSDKKSDDPNAEKKADEKKADDNDVDQPFRARIIRRVQELGSKVGGAVADGAGEVVTEDFWGEMPQSDFWIGVQIAPVAPEIRKHLPVKHGVLVVHVFPDSPAVKAELKDDDILLQAGDAKLETGPDLVKAVDAAKETELSFLILREGKEQKVTVKPSKREVAAEASAIMRRDSLPRMEKLQAAQRQFEKALEALRAETQPDGTVDLMLVRPGAFMTLNAESKMPDDLTVQIIKEGNKPAKVEVKKGEKNWSTTGDKLDALPAEIRPHVERLLNGGSSSHSLYAPTTARMPLALKMAPPAPGAPITMAIPQIATVPAIPPLPALPGIPAAQPAVARAATVWTQALPAHGGSDAKLDQILKKLDSLSSPDLEEMRKELKVLRKEVDELRKKSVDR